MKTLIGLWIIDFAVITGGTFLFYEDVFLEKIKLVIGMTSFMTLVFVGSYLLAG